MRPVPPKRALSFLRWFCREDYLEEIEGDLTELFERQYEQSPGKAKRAFAFSVIRYFRPGFIKSFSNNHHVNLLAMFSNHFKVSWRNLYKQKMYSAIKIGGLALGIAACFLIALFIRDELSYDRHYANGDRIYRVVGLFNDNGQVYKDVWFPAPFASALKQDYPEVEKSGRYLESELFGVVTGQIRRADTADNTYEEGIVYFDQSLLEILNLPMVYGSRKHALAEPNTIVITKRKADKYFPGEDPTGQMLILNNDVSRPYKIGGVIEDFPPTSHLQFDFLITLTEKEFGKGEQTRWMSQNYPTYVMVRAGTNVEALADKMTKGVIEKYYLPAFLASGESNEKAIREMLGKGQLALQPLTEIRLGSDINDGLQHSDMRFLWLFGAIAAFILIIACINFINLSTARSANRAREVGLRKVVGSQRSSIISQFLSESLLFSMISLVLGIALAGMLLPYFNVLAGKSITFPLTEWWLAPVLIATAATTGILAGVYPSFYLSSFKPINVLKGNLSLGSRSAHTRGALVVFQFTVSIVLIVSTVIIYRQMQYILNKELGFDKDQVLLLQGTGTLGDQLGTFKKELQQLRDVKSVSTSDYLPVDRTKRNGNSFWQEGKMKEGQGISGQHWQVDHDYIKTMGMKIVQGRDFNEQMPTDAGAAIINQAMVHALGLEDPVGQRITNGWRTWDVIGVVADFHFESMKDNIVPLCIAIGNHSDIVAVKVSTTDMQGTIQRITDTWKKLAPHQPVRYSFLDQRFAGMYDDIKRMGQIFTSFAVFTVIVACLGLFALSAFMVEQRSKEISIRLVLGASLNNILRLLTQNFIKLVLLSLVLATPIASYVMQRWLEDYTYRTEIGWDVFVIAGIIAVAIALFTVSYQSIRAALVKPVENLRSE
jgi:putative ABC transport system permease protein